MSAWFATAGRLALDDDGSLWLREDDDWHDLGPVADAVVDPADARALQELEDVWEDSRAWDPRGEARGTFYEGLRR